jgi:hypothetical protein
MFSTIVTAAITLVYNLFRSRKSKTKRLRKREFLKKTMFFNPSNKEKITLASKKKHEANFIKVEDKFEKMRSFLDKSQDKICEEKFMKQDQIFFKLFKNFSAIYTDQTEKPKKPQLSKKMRFLPENMIIQN